MTRKTNQEIERYYFELFRRVYPLPDGQVIHGDKPDIIIEGPRKVGIEVTNFFLESGNLPKSEQNQARIREYLLKEAQLRYLAQCGKSFEISFSFNPERPVKRNKKFINELVKLAKLIETLDTGELPRQIYESIPELSFVYLNAKSYSDPKWHVIQVYNVPVMSIQRLTEIVKGKERKAKKYSPCDDYWLLIVVDFINPAQDQEIRVDDIKLKSDIFKKIIIYKTTFEHVVEVSS